MFLLGFCAPAYVSIGFFHSSVKAPSSGNVEKKTLLAIPSSTSTTCSSSPTDVKPKIKLIPKAKRKLKIMFNLMNFV